MPTTSAGYYYADGSTPMSAEDISAAEATAAQEVYDGLVQDSYLFRQTVYFTSSGTFSKASYPWLRAIRVRCVGGGGAGGGSSSSAAGGGAGGSYAEAFITDIAGLASSITVTRGSGAPAPSSGTDGGSGDSSTFGTLVVAPGGGGGATTGVGGLGSITGAVGDLIIKGSDGMGGGTTSVPAGGGGASGLGYGGSTRGDRSNITSSGDSGSAYGGGGSGGRGTSESGGSGAAGIVIVELFG